MIPETRIVAALAVTALYILLCIWIAVVHRRRKNNAVPFAAAQEGTPVLVAHASQTGFAEQLAWRTAQSLAESGRSVKLLRLGDVDADMLAAARQALFIVSTTGEGDAPDSAARFLRKVMPAAAELRDMSYGLLALGDRSYRQFCAFGHRFDRWLRHQQANPLFDLIEVDNADDGALRHWQASLRALGARADMPDWAAPHYRRWRLADRTLLNPGSQGWPAYHIALTPIDPPTEWQAGDIAEIGPFDPGGADRDDLPHREYSIASLPADGRIELIVRQMRDADGRLGLGSGWLTERAAIGGEIALRVRQNSGFHAPELDRPMILIGNGTGLAGLRAHIKARAAQGRCRNWLVFGERSRLNDYFLADEIEQWRADGTLERVDLAFSRDQAQRVYVQHLLPDARDAILDWADRGAAIYVCGSLEGMAPAVHDALELILGSDRLEQMVEDGLYRRDVY